MALRTPGWGGTKPAKNQPPQRLGEPACSSGDKTTRALTDDSAPTLKISSRLGSASPRNAGPLPLPPHPLPLRPSCARLCGQRARLLPSNGRGAPSGADGSAEGCRSLRRGGGNGGSGEVCITLALCKSGSEGSPEGVTLAATGPFVSLSSALDARGRTEGPRPIRQPYRTCRTGAASSPAGVTGVP